MAFSARARSVGSSAPEDAARADQHARPRLDGSLGVVDLDAAVDLDVHRQPVAIHLGADRFDARVDTLVERLPAPPGLDAHEHDIVDPIEVREDRVDRGLHVQGHADAEPGTTGLIDRRQWVGDRLMMERDDVEPSIGELVEVPGGCVDHEVSVHGEIGVWPK